MPIIRRAGPLGGFFGGAGQAAAAFGEATKDTFAQALAVEQQLESNRRFEIEQMQEQQDRLFREKRAEVADALADRQQTNQERQQVIDNAYRTSQASEATAFRTAESKRQDRRMGLAESAAEFQEGLQTKRFELETDRFNFQQGQAKEAREAQDAQQEIQNDLAERAMQLREAGDLRAAQVVEQQISQNDARFLAENEERTLRHESQLLSRYGKNYGRGMVPIDEYGVNELLGIYQDDNGVDSFDNFAAWFHQRSGGRYINADGTTNDNLLADEAYTLDAYRWLGGAIDESRSMRAFAARYEGPEALEAGLTVFFPELVNNPTLMKAASAAYNEIRTMDGSAATIGLAVKQARSELYRVAMVEKQRKIVQQRVSEFALGEAGMVDLADDAGVVFSELLGQLDTHPNPLALEKEIYRYIDPKAREIAEDARLAEQRRMGALNVATGVMSQFLGVPGPSGPSAGETPNLKDMFAPSADMDERIRADWRANGWEWNRENAQKAKDRLEEEDRQKLEQAFKDNAVTKKHAYRLHSGF